MFQHRQRTKAALHLMIATARRKPLTYHLPKRLPTRRNSLQGRRLMADQEPASVGSGSRDGAVLRSRFSRSVEDLRLNCRLAASFSPRQRHGLDVQFNIAVNEAARIFTRSSSRSTSPLRSENGVHFVVDLGYAGLFGLQEPAGRALQPFYDERRGCSSPSRADHRRGGIEHGFPPPLLLDPVTSRGRTWRNSSSRFAGQDTAGRGRRRRRRDEPDPRLRRTST